MPRKKEVDFCQEVYYNAYNQPLVPGEHVLFMAAQGKATRHKTGTFAGVYKKKGTITTIRIDNVNGQKGQSSYLKLKRAFVMKLNS